MKRIKVIRRSTPYHGYTSSRVRNIRVGEGLPPLEDLRDELDEYMDILLGRKDAPLRGPLALMETADMYYARATEINSKILRGEQDGTIGASAPLRKFRTGALRDFREVAKRAADLGSRRLTALGIELEREKTGRESTGDG
jgi:hypothetical protein